MCTVFPSLTGDAAAVVVRRGDGPCLAVLRKVPRPAAREWKCLRDWQRVPPSARADGKGAASVVGRHGVEPTSGAKSATVDVRSDAPVRRAAVEWLD